MTAFTLHDETNAPDAARPLLAGAKNAVGFVPNLYATLAESPATLEAYLALGKLFSKTSFTPIEQQVIYLAINHENGCHYCMAAHSTLALGVNIEADTLANLRAGRTLSDPRQEALRRFAVAVVRERGWVQGPELDAFLDAGFTKAQVIEVILAVGHKTISNYLNHVAETPLDAAFQPQAWERATADA